MGITILACLLLGVVVALLALIHLTQKPVQITGPSSPSWLLGHQSLIANQEDVGDCDFAWVRDYGSLFPINDCFGSEVFMVADPKAVRFIMQSAGYAARKTIQNKTFHRLLAGSNGVPLMDGADHQRHRRIMSPAFAPPQLRALLPVFHRVAASMADHWNQLLTDGGKGQVLLVNDWLSRATLDAIGETGFELNFAALEGEETELTKVYHSLFVDTQSAPHPALLLFQATWNYIPIITEYLQHIPTPAFQRIKEYKSVSERVAQDIIAQKREALKHEDAAQEGKGKDLMNLFIKANAGLNPKHQLNDAEMVSQMTTLLLGGHETIASTMSWLLYELARNPDAQETLRAEVRAARARVRGRDLEATELDSMIALNAFIKETLRFHPILYNIPRIIDRDDILPLSNPIKLRSGVEIKELPVKKGTKVVVSICAYNRLPSVWGPDADKFNIARFMDDKLDANAKLDAQVGVYANLMTFSAGVRSCIGWRFALIELQAITARLVENFAFAPAPGVSIRRAPVQLMMPLVKGKESEGTQMPLLVSIAQ